MYMYGTTVQVTLIPLTKNDRVYVVDFVVT